MQNSEDIKKSLWWCNRNCRDYNLTSCEKSLDNVVAYHSSVRLGVLWRSLITEKNCANWRFMSKSATALLGYVSDSASQATSLRGNCCIALSEAIWLNMETKCDRERHVANIPNLKGSAKVHLERILEITAPEISQNLLKFKSTPFKLLITLRLESSLLLILHLIRRPLS